MKILFYEPDYQGHHFPYLARMLPNFLELPIQASLATTPSAIDSNEYKKTLAPFESSLEILPSCQELIKHNPLANAWRRCHDLKRIVKECQPDHVCILYADGMWPLAALAKQFGVSLLGNAPVYEAWMYRGGFTYNDAKGKGALIRRRLFKKLIDQEIFDKIHFDDELLFDFYQKECSQRTEVSLSRNPVIITDPIPQREARKQLGLPIEGTIIGTSGMITETKGIHLLLDMFEKHATRNPETILMIAGPHNESIKNMLVEERFQILVQQGRLFSIDRFLNDHEMSLSAASCDLILAPYPNHSGRSSIILWAAAAGVPVLAVSRGCIGHVVRTERLGKTCDVKNIDEFGKALDEMLEETWTEDDVQRVKNYADWHSIENYQKSSAALVRSRCVELGLIEPGN